MEAAAVLITPESLRADAQAAREAAERFRIAARDKLAEAIRLEREADALADALRLAPSEGEAMSARAELAGEVAAWLARCRKPKSSTEVAEHFAVSPQRAREALALLVETKMVERSGLKRGTRYRLLRDGEMPSAPTPIGQRWHEHVRDAARKLGTFTQAELADELDHVSDQSVYRWLRRLVDDGLLEVERIGNTNVYAYVAPEATPEPYSRPRHDPHPAAGRRRGSVVIGTGEDRGSRAEVRKIIRKAKASGASVKPQKHGYAVVNGNGEVVTSVPRTPSDHRSLRNAKAKLGAAGIDT